MADSLNATDAYDYDDLPTQSPIIYQKYLMRTRLMWLYVLVYSATVLLGSSLNSSIIIMAIQRAIKRPQEKPLHQLPLIMGLTITHLVFCLITPLYLISAWTHFSWPFGKSLCKLGSYLLFMNMFSNSLIITLWNVRWCVPINTTIQHVSSCMTLLSWFLGAILAAPSLLSRDIQKTAASDTCIENYDYIEMAYMSDDAKSTMLTVALSRFFFGLLLPLGVIGISSCVREHRNRVQQSIVVLPVTIVHFLCWAPVLCLSTVQVGLKKDSEFFTYGLPFTTGLCALNSVICPIICLIQGQEELSKSSGV